VIGATCEEGEGEMINELGDGDDMESGLELWDGCSPRKVSNGSQAFELEYLEMAVIGLGGRAPDWCGVSDDRMQDSIVNSSSLLGMESVESHASRGNIL
jgi:hypothetical protein